MSQALLRFILGGAVVAAVPFVAELLGTATAGVVVLFPAVSFVALLFVGRSQGLDAVAATSLDAALALPTVAAFMLGVHFTAQRGVSLSVVLASGLICWFGAALPIAFWLRTRTP
jgi:uncharacterized membrane protein (GlpM family)